MGGRRRRRLVDLGNLGQAEGGAAVNPNFVEGEIEKKRDREDRLRERK